VYPVDANLIVSLLDLHLSTTENSDEDAPLEIFEAGTGHGSLTLYLARAINGANPPAPPPPRVKHFLEETQSHRPDDKTQDPSSDLNNSLTNEKPRLGQDPSAPDGGFHAYKSYLPRRRAIIQSLDISPRFSEQAQRTVRNFRRGMYYHNVDFHVGTIPSYLSARLASSPSPFLEHAILDLPNCHEFLEIVNQSLKPNGTLMVFCPSITQINTCVQIAKKLFLPWKLETTLELGIGVGVGGREWDVRFIKPRALLKAELESKTRLEEHEQQRSAVEIIDVGEENGNREIIDEKIDDGLKMVCRPMVGVKVTGGGFIAQWRKLS
jgi:tRNA (adenine57-N1/adenine58-N1)-methyltransferase catalytic subunit